mgnify:CR=1 FL=1
MRIRFLSRWRSYRAGQIAELPDGMADVLLRRRIAEPATDRRDEPPAPECAVAEAPPRRAVRRPRTMSERE